MGTKAAASPRSEDDANRLLNLGASALAQLTITRSPSSPTLNLESECVLKDARGASKSQKPANAAPHKCAVENPKGDAALLDALAASNKPAAEMNRYFRHSHRRSRSIE